MAARGSLHEVSCVHLYTDGSSTRDGSSWSVVGLVQVRSGDFIRLGHFAGISSVAPDPTPQHIGAAVHSSFTSELSAIVWALQFLLQLSPPTSACIHYDCQSAAMVALTTAAAMEASCFLVPLQSKLQR